MRRQEIVDGLAAFLVRRGGNGAARFVEYQIDLVGGDGGASVYIDAIGTEIHRRLRVAFHGAIQPHTSRLNYPGSFGPRADAHFGEGSGEAYFFAAAGLRLRSGVSRSRPLRSSSSHVANYKSARVAAHTACFPGNLNREDYDGEAGRYRGSEFVRRRGVASQPYRLVFRSVPRRPSPNLANLVARTRILADPFNQIHTPNLVIGPPDIRVARLSWISRNLLPRWGLR